MIDDRPVLLDAYCCAGGAGMGFHRAGFRVVGVDRDPQPNYPFEFHRADALEFIRDHGSEFDAVHTSPPCQAATTLTSGTNRGKVDHPDLIPATRALLATLDVPTVIENVQGAAMRRDLTLCGTMFGLPILRHRYFEIDGIDWLPQIPHPIHRGRVRDWRHGELFDGPYLAIYGNGGQRGSVEEWQAALGISWTSVRGELAEAIPPAYTELIGRAILDQIRPPGV